MPDPAPALHAAMETVRAHGISPDRCEILQNSSTLVVRLTETLVARVVQDVDGPRQGTAWFARENAMAAHLTRHGAPVIPLHPDLPPGPHQHLGYPLNFWQFVTALDVTPDPAEIGRTLFQCHAVLRSFEEELPRLAIMHESLDLLGTLERRALLPAASLDLLRRHLESSLRVLAETPHQPLHGDAHYGNLMQTPAGLLWADWEDAFAGPVEWDVASIIWNARLLEEDHATADAIVAAYTAAGGVLDARVLQQCLVARAAVISAWYPVLYAADDLGRQKKLQARLEWLACQPIA